MKIHIVSRRDIIKYFIIFLITVGALVGSEGYIAEVSSNLIKKELPVYSVARDDKKIALTFDSAWGNEDIPAILEILKTNNVKSTFFCTGGWIGNYPESVKAIVSAGHELGNHSDTHPHIGKLGKNEITDEIMKVHHDVEEKFNYIMKDFRPPYGEYNNLVVKTVRNLGYEIVQWNVDSWDWMDLTADQIVNKVTNHKKLAGGSIILMHTGAKNTEEALPELIKQLKAKGYEFVTVDELLVKGEYKLDHEGKQHEVKRTEGESEKTNKETKNNPNDIKHQEDDVDEAINQEVETTRVNKVKDEAGKKVSKEKEEKSGSEEDTDDEQDTEADDVGEED